jgi:hypothetical protein
MPTVQIHKITRTLGSAIRYGAKDKKVEKYCKEDIPETIHFDIDEKSGVATFYTLNSYLNCPSNGKDVLKDFQDILERQPRKRVVHGGEKPALAYHIIQSFDGFVSPTIANSIGIEFANEFLRGYRVQISTHTNTDNVHNHIIFACVNDRGERYNDCDATMAKMRKVSDRICQEHGMGVLERTKDYKPKHWTGADGKKHSFEATPRKINLIHKREKKTISRDRVSSYRNNNSYADEKMSMASQKSMIKRDINKYLPYVDSYYQLLTLLEQKEGYKIKAYKRSKINEHEFEFLKHITFQHPSFSKGVRDSSLGNDGFYERQTLSWMIERHIFKGKENKRPINSREQEIQDRLDALHFLEKYNVRNYRSIISTLDRLWEKIHEEENTVSKVGVGLRRAEYIIANPEKYRKRKSPEEIERLKVDVENWREKYADLAKQLVEKRSELERYEDAVASLRDSNGAKNADLSDVWEEIERRRNKREGAGTVIEKADAERRAPKKKRERER